MEKKKIKTYQDLIVWQRARQFVVLLYQLTEVFPGTEMFGLTSQLRRAAVSVPSNIAKGFRRKSDREKAQFLRIAYGSGAELETQLILANDLSFIGSDDFKKINTVLNEVMSMLNKIIPQFES